jgi:hypothetical protein
MTCLARPRRVSQRPAVSRPARHLYLVPTPAAGPQADPAEVRARLGPVRALASAPAHPPGVQPASEPRGSAA